MPDLGYNAAAKEFSAHGNDSEGAAIFKGWLGPPTQAPHVVVEAAATFRFFTSPQFMEWLEIERNDILYQADADADDPESGSVIWVKREARIRRCQAGRAYWFEQLMEETADDPTARHPRPPQ
ncbi:MAG TPA: hypothetical protein VGO80_09030 [Solirubrobacteraceae bacterium]|nr:hypothetical protein [Solirubrobacteraceae bacterium]